jgi:hypothetical protein
MGAEGVEGGDRLDLEATASAWSSRYIATTHMGARDRLDLKATTSVCSSRYIATTHMGARRRDDDVETMTAIDVLRRVVIELVSVELKHAHRDGG